MSYVSFLLLWDSNKGPQIADYLIGFVRAELTREMRHRRAWLSTHVLDCGTDLIERMSLEIGRVETRWHRGGWVSGRWV